MKLNFEHDKITNVAYIDLCLEEEGKGSVTVKDVTEALGMKSQILARFDENGTLLGVIIEDYSAFRSEVRRKYVAFKVDSIIELLVSKIAGLFAEQRQHHRIPACV